MNDFDYKKSGVDINKADSVIKNLKANIGGSIGLFGGIFDLSEILEKYSKPLLVSSTDGIGSKLVLLKKHKLWKIAAIDLVAMNLNDIVCLGAKPIFFMDYIGTHSLNVEDTTLFINYLNSILNKFNCKLIGGELAELPLIFRDGEVDIAGFVVGVVEKEDLLLERDIEEGDKIIGLTSNGIHSNGYSLVNMLLENKKINFEDKLIAPTKLIVDQTLSISKLIKAAAHITGGGIPGNLNRIIPDGYIANIKYNIEIPEIFKKIMNAGVAIEEMFNVFNMGISAVYIVSKDNIEKVNNILKNFGERPILLGEIVKNQSSMVGRVIRSKDNKVRIYL